MKPKRSLSILLLCSLLVGALAVALAPDRYSRILPYHVVDGLRSLYETLIIPPPVEDKPEVSPRTPIGGNTSAPARAVLTQAEGSHIPYLPRGGCVDQTLGKTADKPTLTVFTWTDENGVTHYSDSRSRVGTGKKIAVATGYEMDYYQLNLKAHGVHQLFTDQLRARIRKSFIFYRSLLGKKALRKIAVNMQVFADPAQYANYRRSIHATVAADAPGFYSPSRNESVLLYLGEQQTMETAVHEAAHSITSGLIGETGSWLTEGLSEYLENLQVKMQYAEVRTSPSWYGKGGLRFGSVPLSVLLSADHRQFFTGPVSEIFMPPVGRLSTS